MTSRNCIIVSRVLLQETPGMDVPTAPKGPVQKPAEQEQEITGSSLERSDVSTPGQGNQDAMVMKAALKNPGALTQQQADLARNLMKKVADASKNPSLLKRVMDNS